jgi:hypothetical protein
VAAGTRPNGLLLGHLPGMEQVELDSAVTLVTLGSPACGRGSRLLFGPAGLARPGGRGEEAT